MPALLDHQPRRLEPKPLDGLGRRLPRFEREHAAELAGAQVNGLGQFLDRQRAAQVLARIVQRILDAVRFRREVQHFGMLRLAARAALVHDQLVRDRPRRFGAQILFHHREREVEAGRHAGGGPDRPVDDVDPVVLDADIRKALLHLAPVCPVRGRTPLRQQARFREHEPAGADARDAPRARARLAQEREHTVRRGRRERIVDPGDDPRIHVEPAAQRPRAHCDAERRAHVAARDREIVERVERLARREVRVLEYRLRRERHDLEPVADQEADPVHVRSPVDSRTTRNCHAMS